MVDPVGDIQTYLRAAKDFGVHLHYVFDTHVHADHLPRRALADAAGSAG